MQPLRFFFFSKIDERSRESPLCLWSINPLRVLYAKSTISKEIVEGLLTGYQGACYYFSEHYKRSQVIMLMSRKLYLACLNLGQPGGGDGGGGGGVGWHCVPQKDQPYTYKNSCHLDLADFV